MPSIRFKDVPTSEITNLKSIFEYIKNGKAKGTISARKLRKLLGKRYKTKFWFPTRKEQDKWLEDWQNASVEERQKKLKYHKPWDFGSWLIALMNADIELVELTINESGDGSLVYEQLAWPSGGVDALEELIRIYDGVILS